jgi:seryl-tRNA synthetase
MHDIRALRDTPDAFDAALCRRPGVAPVAARVLGIDEARRAAINAAETTKADQNAASKAAGAAKAAGNDAEFERLRALVAEKKADLARLEDQARTQDATLRDLLLTIPNLPLPEVPDGEDEHANVELYRWGTPPVFDFEAKEHFEIVGPKTKGFAFYPAAQMSGSRFVILTDAVARLHRALGQFMMDIHINENALRECWVPVLVNSEAMVGTGQLPKFADDSYQTTNGWWLIPTAEVPLTNMVAGGKWEGFFEGNAFPMRLVAHTQCFRSEAGSAGRDTRGMLRQHQFEKVEMVSITRPDNSLAEHARMTACAEGILQRLNLPYRTMLLCTGDMGFGAQKTHDIEVWLPGQNAYREISSISVCGDFQARRMNARFRPESGAKPEYVHTLNGSGLAVGRCLIAVLENGQRKDGSVVIPEALRSYMGGKSSITPEGHLA